MNAENSRTSKANLRDSHHLPVVVFVVLLDLVLLTVVHNLEYHRAELAELEQSGLCHLTETKLVLLIEVNELLYAGHDVSDVSAKRLEPKDRILLERADVKTCKDRIYRHRSDRDNFL